MGDTDLYRVLTYICKHKGVLKGPYYLLLLHIVASITILPEKLQIYLTYVSITMHPMALQATKGQLLKYLSSQIK